MIRQMGLLAKALRVICVQRRALEILEAENLILQQKVQVGEVYREGVDALQRQVLDERRERLALVSAWRISIEKPEVDIRGDLDLMIRGLQDEVAQIEEQVV